MHSGHSQLIYVQESTAHAYSFDTVIHTPDELVFHHVHQEDSSSNKMVPPISQCQDWSEIKSHLKCKLSIPRV